MFSFGIFAITRCGRGFAVACIVNGILLHVITFAIGMKLGGVEGVVGFGVFACVRGVTRKAGWSIKICHLQPALPA